MMDFCLRERKNPAQDNISFKMFHQFDASYSLGQNVAYDIYSGFSSLIGGQYEYF